MNADEVALTVMFLLRLYIGDLLGVYIDDKCICPFASVKR